MRLLSKWSMAFLSIIISLSILLAGCITQDDWSYIKKHLIPYSEQVIGQRPVKIKFDSGYAYEGGGVNLVLIYTEKAAKAARLNHRLLKVYVLLGYSSVDDSDWQHDPENVTEVRDGFDQALGLDKVTSNFSTQKMAKKYLQPTAAVEDVDLDTFFDAPTGKRILWNNRHRIQKMTAQQRINWIKRQPLAAKINFTLTLYLKGKLNKTQREPDELPQLIKTDQLPPNAYIQIKSVDNEGNDIVDNYIWDGNRFVENNKSD